MKNEKTKKALFIVNPKSGTMKLKNSMLEIAEELCRNNYLTTLVPTLKQGDATAYVNDLADEHDLIVCSGGDGTINEVVSGIIKFNKDIPLALMPAGTTNDIATTLKLPSAIPKLTEVVVGGREVYHDVGMLNDEKYFSYVCCFGAFTKVSYDTPQWLKNRIGHFAYIVDGISRLSENHPKKAKIKADDFEIEDEFILGVIANSHSVAGFFKFDENDVSLNDGKFEVLLVKNIKSAIDISKAVRDIADKKYTDDNVIFLNASSISIEFEEETSLNCDGEFAGKYKKIEIKNINNKLKFILPKEENDE